MPRNRTGVFTHPPLILHSEDNFGVNQAGPDAA